MSYSFSPSSLRLLKECPRCFWLHFHGVKRPDSIFPSLPAGMDRILKEHFNRFRDKSQLPPELKELIGVTLFEDKVLLEEWQNAFKGLKWKDEKGNILRGAVDNILKKDNVLIVLDYKTRGYAPTETTVAFSQDQMNIYTFLLQQNGYDVAEYAYLLFYYPNTVSTNGDVLFHTELVKVPVDISQAKSLFEQALAVVTGPIPAVEATCQFCQWTSEKPTTLLDY